MRWSTARRKNLPAHEKQTPKQIGHAFKEGIWALLMPIIILGGIFGGIFTPTEAAAVAVVYALIISLTVYRDMKLSELPQVFVEASVSTATIMMMVGLSKASSYVVVTSGLPQQLLDVFTSITSNRIVILLLLNLLFLIIGMLMEANAAIIMMTPILTPLLTAFNIDAAAVRYRHELQPVHWSGHASCGPVPADLQPDRQDPPDESAESHDAHAADLRDRPDADHLYPRADHMAAQHD